MFVVFEGIDGSGKTTVSNRVAKALRKRGIAVQHVRESGLFSSELVARMREFGKDTRNLTMAPLAELLLYCAREAQLIDECIRPALDRGALVFADRYLYSHEVLAHFGRGMPPDQARALVDTVAGGLWPDLVVLLDVDPFVARARRKVSKLRDKGSKPRGHTGGSRKGLGGVGVQHRMRAGYLALSERESERWLVIDNGDPGSPESALDAVVAHVAELIARLWHARASAAAPPGRVDIHRILRQERRTVNISVPRSITDLATARDEFYRLLEARARRELEVAAYFLSGLADDRAHDLRHAWSEAAPQVVAYGLRGLGDDRAWALRRDLVGRAPYHVARSLDGRAVDGERADAMRAELIDRQPYAVLATLDGNDTAPAWELRERMIAVDLARVVASLKRIDSERAWALRQRYIEHLAGTRDPRVLAPLIASLRGLPGERAWQLREHYLGDAPVAVLESLADVDDPRSWELRAAFAATAPRIVLRTIDGSDDPRAWSLRTAHAPRVKEALDSMTGLDSDAAWTVREQCRDIWPSTVVKSLGELGVTDRGAELARATVARYPRNISLLKHVARLVAMGAPDPDGGTPGPQRDTGGKGAPDGPS